jgi:carbon storage regulator
MLVLSRKPGEKLIIDNNITITVLEVAGHRVKLGVEAPHDVRVLRGELAWWQEDQTASAAPRRARPRTARAATC